MSRIQDEDYEQPIFLEYEKQWVAYGNKQLHETLKKIEQFEKTHPLLTLVDGSELENYKKVLGKQVLFTDSNQEYKEIKYQYKMYNISCYYEPSEELHEFLTHFRTRAERKKHTTILKKVIR